MSVAHRHLGRNDCADRYAPPLRTRRQRRVSAGCILAKKGWLRRQNVRLSGATQPLVELHSIPHGGDAPTPTNPPAVLPISVAPLIDAVLMSGRLGRFRSTSLRMCSPARGLPECLPPSGTSGCGPRRPLPKVSKTAICGNGWAANCKDRSWRISGRAQRRRSPPPGIDRCRLRVASGPVVCGSTRIAARRGACACGVDGSPPTARPVNSTARPNPSLRRPAAGRRLARVCLALQLSSRRGDRDAD